MAQKVKFNIVGSLIQRLTTVLVSTNYVLPTVSLLWFLGFCVRFSFFRRSEPLHFRCFWSTISLEFNYAYASSYIAYLSYTLTSSHLPMLLEIWVLFRSYLQIKEGTSWKWLVNPSDPKLNL